MRDITRAMLVEISNLAVQVPGLVIAERAEQLGLRLPAPGTLITPPHSRAGSTVGGGGGGSRPGSARSGGSARSTGSAPRGGSRPGNVRQVQIGL